ncbi:MFS general substrate transporter [Aspergillus pseudodeflectus]|uniref:MFS general substrate transporter n=1 Tax=Aspergillus pseudodeflectus TaxID=176178 RepID=A0ABR4KC20_9EURO
MEPKVMPSSIQALSLQPTDEFPEGGYGWVCVVSIFLINAHTWGINGAFGVILSFYLSENQFPGTSSLVYAAVSGVGVSFALLISPLVTYLNPFLPKRTVIVLGAILIAAALIGASFTTQSWQLWLSQGICYGLGMGCLFTSTVAIANGWFKRRRGIANGIVAAGSGTGGLIYSLATNHMIKQFGFRWAFRILGIVALAVNLVAGLLVRERPGLPPKKGTGLISSSTLRQPTFILFLIFGFFGLLSYISLLFSIASYAQAVGLGSNTGSLASALLNLGQAFGRPLVGALSDRFGRIKVPAISLGLCGLLCMVFWPFATSSGALYAFSILAGLGAGTIWAAAPAVAADLIELPQVPGALTVLWLVLVPPGTVAEVIALQLREKEGKWTLRGGYLPVQMFVGATYFAAAGALGGIVLLRFWATRGTQRHQVPGY